MSALLLDTCALIWLAEHRPMREAAVAAAQAASETDDLCISVVSAWEVGLIARRRALEFLPDPKTWFRNVLAGPGIRLVAITPDIAVDSSELPGDFHKDPADRMLVASALALDVPIVTSDRLILAYADQGHVRAIAC